MSKELNNQEQLKTEFQSGIVEDLFWAQYSFFVYRLIAENSHELNSALKTDEGMRHQMNYHQTTAQQHCVLQLAKVFEKRDKNFPNRCISRTLDSLRIHALDFDPNLYESEDIKLLRTFILGKKGNMPINNTEDLVKLMNKALNSRQIQSSIKNLMVVRNKYIAHNEKLDSSSGNDSFWQDFELLLRFGRLLRNVISQHLFYTTYSWSDSIGDEVVDNYFRIELYWIIKQIEDIVGKEKIILKLPKWSFSEKSEPRKI